MSAQKKWVAVCRQCGRVEITQKTKPTSCKTVIKVGAASERRCGLPLVRQTPAAICDRHEPKGQKGGAA